MKLFDVLEEFLEPNIFELVVFVLHKKGIADQRSEVKHLSFSKAGEPFPHDIAPRVQLAFVFACNREAFLSDQHQLGNLSHLIELTQYLSMSLHTFLNRLNVLLRKLRLKALGFLCR